jgi:DNA invertase Pin-like site-specific DNA recombinase
MKADIGVSYLRLSDEDIKKGESESITNQRRFIKDYCARNGITLIGEFVDDGWSGGNFERPGFQNLMRELQKGKISIVITKDLSRLGRDMREASYYAEQFFPEHGIRYIAINDNFDSEVDNVMAPFQFAMNEVYLRDGSKKIKQVLKNKRENGLYCACPPFGYKKDLHDKNLLVPDENTAPTVQRIFRQAANGDSTRKIAIDLNNDNVIPPLKYRALYRDGFTEKGTARASDYWCYTTVKRILKNEVYLGHTILGKTKKASLKSNKKVLIDKEDWVVTKNTHEPLVSEDIFERAKINLGRNTKKYEGYERVRKSIFSGIVYCAKCGSSLCSCGSVYNGEREKYWYLGCTKKRKDIVTPCPGVRIRYTDLVELITRDLNSFICMNDEEIREIADELIRINCSEDAIMSRKGKIEKAKARLSVIDKMISKLYLDNAEGKISDKRLKITVDELEIEYTNLSKTLLELEKEESGKETLEGDVSSFFNLVKQYTHIEELTRDILLTFVDKIEISEKVYSDDVIRDTHNNKPFTQEIKIYYKFIQDVLSQPQKEFPINLKMETPTREEVSIKEIV